MDNQVSIVISTKDYNLTEEDELTMMMGSMGNEGQKGMLVHIGNDNDNDTVYIILHTSGYYLKFSLLDKYDLDKLKINKSCFIMDDCVDIDDKTIINCTIEDVL